MASKPAHAEEADILFVLLGKTGVGKSSAGNTILGTKVFKCHPSQASRCQVEKAQLDGQKLAVVDTPGLLNTKNDQYEVKTDIRKYISMAAPGPCIFLVVTQASSFTKEEQETLKVIRETFGEPPLHYTVVLFTCGDNLEADEVNIEDIINGNPDLSDFIGQCSAGYHVFNNREKDPSQVRELLKKINTVVQNTTGKCYAYDVVREAERAEGKMQGELRIVLVGKTGVGKSASGNTILGRAMAFQSTSSSASVTQVCKKETRDFEGQTLVVVDTPGLFDTKANQPDVIKEIARCILYCSPGPHVFLVVITATRFTKEEQETVKIIQSVFKKAACYTMALFTRGDDLKNDGVTIKNFIDENPALGDFIGQCEGGYHVFNNRDINSSQIKELLEKINTMVQKNGGKYYSDEKFEHAEKAIEEKIKKLQRKNPGMTYKEARKRAEEKNWFLKAVLAAAGAAAGVGAGIGIEVAVAGAIGAVGGPVGAAVGALVGLVMGGITVAVKKNACAIQ